MTYELTVRPFEMGTEKESAVKVLEEAAEVFAAFQEMCNSPSQCNEQCELLNVCELKTHFANELADVIQAACNLADRYEIDLQAAMERCEKRNRDRGRYE